MEKRGNYWSRDLKISEAQMAGYRQPTLSGYCLKYQSIM
jgi:hypothetical protein